MKKPQTYHLFEFIGQYGIPYDLMLRLLQLNLLSFMHISNKKGGGKDPYIIMDSRTWGTMHALKRNSQPFINRIKNCGFITLKEASAILGWHSHKKVIRLLNESILTELKPAFKVTPISTQPGSRSTLVVIDSWFMEYGRYSGILSTEDTPESVTEQAFKRTLCKLLVTY